MSEQDKRRGPQGVQGVQGVEGIEGQGIQGIQGEQGERGITGARGRGVLSRNVTLSFGIVVLVAFIILAVFALQVSKTRQIGRENRDLIEQVVEAREKIVRGFERADRALCLSANEQGDILADLIRGVEKGATDISEESRRQFQLALVRLAPRDCSKLPNQRQAKQ